jgi:hypothetical protein
MAGRYLQVFRKLEESYDQMVHPQKRMDIRKVRSHSSCSILHIAASEKVPFGARRGAACSSLLSTSDNAYSGLLLFIVDLHL